jgi:hypothetical protein
MEEFKKIANYNYSVSNMGNVRNDKTNRILKPGIDGNGYYYVILYKNGKTKLHKVHRLIANAFIANPNGTPCVDHVDNNRINNNISNLRWCSHTENNRNRSISCNNSSGIKGVSFHKKSQKWRACIMLDGILIHIGYYTTLEEATQARVNRARQAFGQYVNACEGINHGAKPMKIRKPKPIVVKPVEIPVEIPDVVQQIKPDVEKQIVKLNVQKIYENIVQLNDALKIEFMKL